MIKFVKYSLGTIGFIGFFVLIGIVGGFENNICTNTQFVQGTAAGLTMMFAGILAFI